MKWWQRLLVALLGGAVTAAAFQPVLGGWGWLFVIPGWAAFWWAIKGAGVRWGARCGFVFGMALYGLSLTWLWQIFGLVAVAMWMLLALFSGVAGGIGGWLSRRGEATRWMPVVAAAAWTGVEFFRCEWFVLRFPWITPGMGMGPTWLSSWIGVYGVGFLVVLSTALLVLGRRMKGVEIGLLVFLILLGVWKPGPVDGLRAEDRVPVLLVQSEASRFDRYLEMSRASGFRDGLVVWPEYALPYDIERYGEAELPQLAMWVSEADVVAVIGTQEELDDGHYNSALTLDDSGPLGRHAKCRTVHFMNDGTPGEVAEPIETRWGRVGTPICFDCDFTRVARQMTAAGAEWFAMPSMDPEPWGERQHWQHAELFRHRAAENGRWFAVASSSGATRFVDPHGVVRSELPLMDEGVLAGEVWRRKKLTFFTRAGWLTPWVLSGIAVSGIVAGFRIGRQGRRAGRQGPFCSRPPARPRYRGSVLTNWLSRSARFRRVRRGGGWIGRRVERGAGPKCQVKRAKVQKRCACSSRVFCGRESQIGTWNFFLGTFGWREGELFPEHHQPDASEKRPCLSTAGRSGSRGAGGRGGASQA